MACFNWQNHTLHLSEKGNGKESKTQTLVLANFEHNPLLCTCLMPSDSDIDGTCMQTKLLIRVYGLEHI